MRWPNFGLLALVVAAGGIFTGVFLGFNYAPTLDRAHDSVVYIQTEVTGGAFLRGLHHWAGNLAIVLAAIHGARLFWVGAYKAPRRLLWMLGCGLFLVLVGFAYTGYLLPGDARSYAGLTIMEEVAGASPAIGASASALVKGGPEISSVTLARIHTVHTVVLPLALIALGAAFVFVWRKRGAAPNPGEAPASWLHSLHRDAFAAVVVMLVVAACAWIFPAALGDKLDPAETSPDAKPEWFLLWVNELLYRVKGSKFVIAGLLPGLLVGLALGAPFLFRGTHRAPGKRIPELAFVGVILLAIAGLTTASVMRSASQAPDADTDTEEEQPQDDSPAGASELDAQAAAVMKRFRCASCHKIDGDDDGGDTGPILLRDGSGHLPPFKELYSRTYFRLKVGDPEKLWSDPADPETDLELTGMKYRRRAGLPTKEQLDVLEKWFYRDTE